MITIIIIRIYYSDSNKTLPIKEHLNPLSANFTKWSNTPKLFVGNLSTNCLSVFGHFLGLAPKGLINLDHI